MRRRFAARACAAAFGAAMLAGAGAAQAQVFSMEAFHGLADVRLTAADGERSWLDGGFGKTAASGARDGDFKLEPSLSEAAIEWKPRFNFAFGGVVVAEAQPALDPAFDITEAYLTLKAPPNQLGRLSGRVGYFYPPVSLEHEGVAWTTPDMLSASALNTWIGEEVKVMGAEGTLRRAFGDHEVAATAAVFGWNDTSGTLLTFRGWALHGVKSGLSTDFGLPPLSRFMLTKQAPITTPVEELDHRAGYYGHLEWRPPAPVVLDALYYDNAGNRTAVEALQWAWETRFLNIGLRWDVDERTKVLAQAMNGETLMGFRNPTRGLWVDMGYHAAYLLASRQYGEHALSGRVDWFETNDRTYRDVDNNDEEGWAFTGAWRQRLTPHADFIVEAQHVTSRRPSRALARESARRNQTVLQTALRLSF
jgi:hypothetical protein